MESDRLYLEQTFSGVRELADELRGELKYMRREELEQKCQLLAWRFKGLDDAIIQEKKLPDAWTCVATTRPKPDITAPKEE